MPFETGSASTSEAMFVYYNDVFLEWLSRRNPSVYIHYTNKQYMNRIFITQIYKFIVQTNQNLHMYSERTNI